MSKELYHVLASGVVVDKAAVNASDVTALQAMFEALKFNREEVLVVSHSDQFFTSDNMIKLIEAGSPPTRPMTPCLMLWGLSSCVRCS